MAKTVCFSKDVLKSSVSIKDGTPDSLADQWWMCLTNKGQTMFFSLGDWYRLDYAKESKVAKSNQGFVRTASGLNEVSNGEQDTSTNTTVHNGSFRYVTRTKVTPTGTHVPLCANWMDVTGWKAAYQRRSVHHVTPAVCQSHSESAWKPSSQSAAAASHSTSAANTSKRSCESPSTTNCIWMQAVSSFFTGRRTRDDKDPSLESIGLYLFYI